MRDLLFTSLLTSVTVSCLIPLVSMSFILLKNRLSIRSKYFIWLGILVSLLIPFRLPLQTGLIEVRPPVAVLPTPPLDGGATVRQASVASATAPTLTIPWLHLLVALWLVGVLVTLGRQLYSYLKFQRLLKRWGDPVEDPAIWGLLDAVRADMGIKRGVQLIFCPLVHSPLLFGFRQPTIVLPELDYSQEEWELIFHHELVHLQHGDVYISLLAMVIKSLHWYNPLVRFATKELLEAGEMYCDATVLANQDLSYRTFYGETILTMIDRSKKNQVALTTCFYSNRFNLKRRILAIMDNRYPWRTLSLVAVATIACLLLVSRSLFVMAQPPAPVVQSTSVESTAEPVLRPEEAAQRALAEAGLSQEQVTELAAERQENHYLVRFRDGQTQYEYHLDAFTGQVLRLNQTTLVLVSASESSASSSTSHEANPDAIPNPSSPAYNVPGAAPQLANQAEGDDDDQDDDEADDAQDDPTDNDDDDEDE